MEKNNNISSSNGFTNSEMYNMSRNGAIESVGFWTADLDYIKEKTTFAKAQNGTIANLCDWYDNGATYFEKVDGRWFELDEERAESIKAALREKGRKMVEAAKKAMMEQSGKNRMNEANVANIYTVNQIEIIDKELDEVWDEILENLSEEEYLEEEMKYNYGRECDETVARAIRLERKKEGLQRGGYENALAMMKKVADWFTSDKVIGGKVLDSSVDRWEPICTQDLTERAWCSADVNPRSCEVRFGIIFDGDYECTDTFTCPIAELGEKTAVQLAKLAYIV